MLGVSLATIKRYLKQRREVGHVRPKAVPGRAPQKRAKLQAWLEPQLRAHADVIDESGNLVFGFPAFDFTYQ